MVVCVLENKGRSGCQIGSFELNQAVGLAACICRYKVPWEFRIVAMSTETDWLAMIIIMELFGFCSRLRND